MQHTYDECFQKGEQQHRYSLIDDDISVSKYRDDNNTVNNNTS